MDPINVPESDYIVFDKLLNNTLHAIMSKLNLDKLEVLPVVFNREIPEITPYHEEFHSVSTIAYCLRTSNDMLIITFEVEQHRSGGYSLLCIRDSRGLKEYFPDNTENKDKIHNGIKKYYEHHCGLLAQSRIKSAAN